MSIPQTSARAARMLGVLRVVAAIMFITSGTTILFGWPVSPVPMPPLHVLSQIGIGGILETFGGLAILIGLFTRPAAFVLSGMMAVAYFQFHAPQSLYPTVNGGIAAVLYSFLFLYLVFAGAGAWSIDAVLARRVTAHARAGRACVPLAAPELSGAGAA
jgi:putative oxidoreductase